MLPLYAPGGVGRRNLREDRHLHGEEADVVIKAVDGIGLHSGNDPIDQIGQWQRDQRPGEIGEPFNSELSAAGVFHLEQAVGVKENDVPIDERAVSVGSVAWTASLWLTRVRQSTMPSAIFGSGACSTVGDEEMVTEEATTECDTRPSLRLVTFT